MIPLKPDFGTYDLTEDEMKGLAWFVISGCTREEAFLKFVRPDFVGTGAKAALKNAITQFFATKDARDFIDAYRQTLEKALGATKSATPSGNSLEDIEARKLNAKTKLMDFAMELAENIENADDPEFVLKIADKVNLLGDGDIQEEPRRYLPESCELCAYRKFCEENTEDMCPSCKYYQFGEDNGVHYDKTEMLDKKE